MQESFTKAVGYCTYRPKNRSQQYVSKIASRIAKLIKELRSQLKRVDFDNIDPISSLAFLKEFRDAFNSTTMHERAAMWMTSYFMKQPASSSLQAH